MTLLLSMPMAALAQTGNQRVGTANQEVRVIDTQGLRNDPNAPRIVVQLPFFDPFRIPFGTQPPNTSDVNGALTQLGFNPGVDRIEAYAWNPYPGEGGIIPTLSFLSTDPNTIRGLTNTPAGFPNVPIYSFFGPHPYENQIIPVPSMNGQKYNPVTGKIETVPPGTPVLFQPLTANQAKALQQQLDQHFKDTEGKGLYVLDAKGGGMNPGGDIWTKYVDYLKNEKNKTQAEAEQEANKIAAGTASEQDLQQFKQFLGKLAQEGGLRDLDKKTFEEKLGGDPNKIIITPNDVDASGGKGGASLPGGPYDYYQLRNLDSTGKKVAYADPNSNTIVVRDRFPWESGAAPVLKHPAISDVALANLLNDPSQVDTTGGLALNRGTVPLGALGPIALSGQRSQPFSPIAPQAAAPAAQQQQQDQGLANLLSSLLGRGGGGQQGGEQQGGGQGQPSGGSQGGTPSGGAPQETFPSGTVVFPTPTPAPVPGSDVDPELLALINEVVERVLQRPSFQTALIDAIADIIFDLLHSEENTLANTSP